MTKIIAHRGLINGPSAQLENHPNTISTAITKGFDAEIDLWYHNDGLWLGHDNPTYEIPLDFLYDHAKKLWIHAKTPETIVWLTEYTHDLNFFYHDRDLVTLTSRGIIWTYLGCEVAKSKSSVMVMPEMSHEGVMSREDINCWYAICTDWACDYREMLTI